MSSNIHSYLSWILSPPSMLFLCTILFSFFSPYGAGNIDPLMAFILATTFMVILPGFPVMLELYSEGIKLEDFNIKSRRKRTTYYFIFITTFAISTILFYAFSSKALFLINLVFLIGGIISIIINYLWVKISMHVASVCTVVTALNWIYGVKFLPLYSLVLLIAWSRYKFKAHTLLEILLGITLPLIGTSIIYLYLW